MSAAAISPTPLLGNEASRLLDEFAVSQAADLARGGALDRAESLLRSTVERVDAPIAALDLQARVCAQQGRLNEAARWWQEVLRREPANAAAQAALARLNNMQRRPIWLQMLWPMAVGFAVLSLAALILTWQAKQQSAASARLQDHVAAILMAGSQSNRQLAQAVLVEMQALKESQAQTEAGLARLSGFSTKLDGWASAHEVLSGQLKELQSHATRQTLQQEALVVASSNQMNTLRLAFQQELGLAKGEFHQEVTRLQADGKKLAAQLESRAASLSNEFTALRLAVDRERALTAEIEQRRIAGEKLQAEYRTLTASYEAMLAKAGQVKKAPTVTIAVPGVIASVLGSEFTVGFDDGLFDHGTHFKPGAKDRLLEVARVLGQSAEPLQIQVVGFADDDRAFFNWSAQWESSLALDRATAVVDHFIALGLFQPQKLSAASGGSQQRPFASDSVQNRSRNRTVVLKVIVDRQNN